MADYSRYLAELRSVLDNLPLSEAEGATDILFRAYQTDHAVFIFGNGGSAALASHMASDIGKATHIPGPSRLEGVKRLKVLSLADNVPLLTAWANDSSYENVFAAQMENFIQVGDVAFAISGSGNSPNVLRALELARRAGAVTVGLAGCGGGRMKSLLDCPMVVASSHMQQIEDAHLILAHMIFLDLRTRIGKVGIGSGSRASDRSLGG